MLTDVYWLDGAFYLALEDQRKSALIFCDTRKAYRLFHDENEAFVLHCNYWVWNLRIWSLSMEGRICNCFFFLDNWTVLAEFCSFYYLVFLSFHMYTML